MSFYQPLDAVNSPNGRQCYLGKKISTWCQIRKFKFFSAKCERLVCFSAKYIIVSNYITQVESKTLSVIKFRYFLETSRPSENGNCTNLTFSLLILWSTYACVPCRIYLVCAFFSLRFGRLKTFSSNQRCLNRIQ